MPYADPARREQTKRKALEATSWADAQIGTLRAMGVVHTEKEWALLRSYMRRERLAKP